VSSGVVRPADSALEALLDELLVELADLDPRQTRHLLAEAEAHLRDCVAQAVAAGADEREAEAEAVRRFGAASEIARAERRRKPIPLPVALRAVLTSGWLLGSIGALAVGLSGLIAAVIRFTAGAQFLVDSAPGQSYAPGDCHRWLAAFPHAHSCHQAAILDWADETVAYRLALGVLGGLALLAFVAVRRRWSRNGRWAIMPPAVLDAVAGAVFAVAGAAVVLSALSAAVSAHGHGVGQWLSAAAVALPAAAIAGWRLLGQLRSRRQLAVIGS
jgi:hypothetical protein